MRGVPKESDLPSYLCTRTFEGPLLGMSEKSLTNSQDAIVIDGTSWFAEQD